MRLKPGDLDLAQSGAFQQHHECRVTLPIEDALTDEFLLNVRSNLRAGDKLTIVRYADREWKAMTEVVETRVIAVGPEGVRLHRLGGIEIIPVEPGAVPVSAAPVERYSDGTWTVLQKKGKWCVVDGVGEIIIKDLKDKETAQAIANGDKSLSEAA